MMWKVGDVIIGWLDDWWLNDWMIIWYHYSMIGWLDDWMISQYSIIQMQSSIRGMMKSQLNVCFFNIKNHGLLVEIEYHHGSLPNSPSQSGPGRGRNILIFLLVHFECGWSYYWRSIRIFTNLFGLLERKGMYWRERKREKEREKERWQKWRP